MHSALLGMNAAVDDILLTALIQPMWHAGNQGSAEVILTFVSFEWLEASTLVKSLGGSIRRGRSIINTLPTFAMHYAIERWGYRNQ